MDYKTTYRLVSNNVGQVNMMFLQVCVFLCLCVCVCARVPVLLVSESEVLSVCRKLEVVGVVWCVFAYIACIHFQCFHTRVLGYIPKISNTTILCTVCTCVCACLHACAFNRVNATFVHPFPLLSPPHRAPCGAALSTLATD